MYDAVYVPCGLVEVVHPLVSHLVAQKPEGEGHARDEGEEGEAASHGTALALLGAPGVAASGAQVDEQHDEGGDEPSSRDRRQDADGLEVEVALRIEAGVHGVKRDVHVRDRVEDLRPERGLIHEVLLAVVADQRHLGRDLQFQAPW